MLSLDQLAALDLLLWLRTSERAAELALTNQSTISRRSRAALEVFALRLQRSPCGWRLRGDTQLLALERRVHQGARFQGRQPLRLQIPYWSQPLIDGHLPGGWCANPLASRVTCEDPVRLLRQRVIDACLLTPTQIPAEADDLVLLDLYHRPIDLTLFATAGETQPRETFRQQREQGGLTLRLLPFLPASCRERSGQWFEALGGGGDRQLPRSDPEAEPLSVAFLTREMRLAQDQPVVVEESFEPFPYVERLAVLAENHREAAVQQLQEHLQGVFQPLARML